MTGGCQDGGVLGDRPSLGCACESPDATVAGAGAVFVEGVEASTSGRIRKHGMLKYEGGVLPDTLRALFTGALSLSLATVIGLALGELKLRQKLTRLYSCKCATLLTRHAWLGNLV